MNVPCRRDCLVLFLLLLTGGVLGAFVGPYLEDPRKSLLKLEEAFLLINHQFVDPVDPNKVAEDAIGGMLESLDPHSSYLDASEFQDVAESFRGSFGGIGIWFQIIGDTVRVVSPIENGPSEKVGVRAGDRILAVNDSSVIGSTEDEVRHRLKGPVGTQVQVTLYRLGLQTPFSVLITRDMIPLYSVTSNYMVDSLTGYIRISRFAQTTYSEFAQALDELKSQGMERLILDLRDNGGGLLQSAVSITDELLSGRRTIVSTKGRNSSPEVYRTRFSGRFETQPLILLINHNSISASEIVAGALQDHDRALLIGQRTYGKGLVQNQFALPDQSRLQITTARYYTPSGRLIQTPYEKGDRQGYLNEKLQVWREADQDPQGYLSRIPDSLKFKTKHGRTVLGGGGITPDHLIVADSLMPRILQALYGGALFETFRLWFERNEQTLRSRWEAHPKTFISDFTFSPVQWEGLWSAGANAQIPVTFVSRNPSTQTLEFTFGARSENESTLRRYFKAHLGRQLYGSRVSVPLFNAVDEVFQKSQAHWPEAHELSLLSQ